MSSTQVLHTSKKLDEGFEPWRNRPLGEFLYLILDARFEKPRLDAKVISVAILSAIGVDKNGDRRVLGLTMAMSEAKNYWKEFLESLTKRGLHGVEFIVSDDHGSLNAAHREVFPNATWERCQFYFTKNAIKHCPNTQIKKGIAKELRTIYDAENLEQAEGALKELVAKYATIAPKLAVWLENNVTRSLDRLLTPKEHRVSKRMSNLNERAINQEVKQRTRKARAFPNESSLIRLITSVIFNIEKKWVDK